MAPPVNALTQYNIADFLRAKQYIVPNLANDAATERELCLEMAKNVGALDTSENTALTPLTIPATFPSNTFGNDMIVNNLSLETPNFMIKSAFVLRGPNEDTSGESHTLDIGTNTHGPHNKQLELDLSSSAVYDGSIVVDISTNYGPFMSVDTSGTWTTLFTPDVSNNFVNDTLALATNSHLNNTGTGTGTGVSLVSVVEDISFNTVFAIGQNTDYYFISGPMNSLIPVSISGDVTITSNNIIFDISYGAFNLNSINFGTYKFFQNESQGDRVVTPGTTNLVQFAVTETSGNLMTGLFTQNEFQSLFSNYAGYNADGWTFAIEVSGISGGYYPQYPISAGDISGAFLLDNNSILKNAVYMAAGLQNETNYVEFTQAPMDISSNPGSLDSNITNGYITVTSTGETLNEVDSSGNGVVEIGSFMRTNRVWNSPMSAAAYNKHTVNYELDNSANQILGTQRTEYDVSYNVLNTLVSTGGGRYGSYADSNDASLFVNGAPSFTIDFSSNIQAARPTDWATYITVSVSKSFVDHDLSGGSFFALASQDASGDVDFAQPQNAISNVKTTSFNPGALNYDDYRVLCQAKTIPELDISGTIGDWGTSNTQWQFTLDSGDTFLKSSVEATERSIVPSHDDIVALIEDPLQSITINFSYDTTANLGGNSGSSAYAHDMATFSWTDLSANVQSVPVYQNGIAQVTLPGTTTTFKGWAETLGSIQYIIVEKTVVTYYNAYINLPIGAFSNLNIRTPVVRSTLVTYSAYSNSAAVNIGGTPVVPATHNSYANSLSGGTSSASAAQLSKSVFKNTAYTPNETIVDDNTGLPVQSSFVIQRAAVMALTCRAQVSDDTAPLWTDLSGTVTKHLDPYFGTQTVISLEPGLADNTIIEIQPEDSHTANETYLTLIQEYYAIPLLKSTDVSTDFAVAGYSWDANNASSFVCSPSAFSPNNFTVGAPYFPVAPSPFDSIAITTTVAYDANLQAVLTLTDTNSSSVLAVITAHNAGFIEDMTIFSVPKPVFAVEGTNATHAMPKWVQGGTTNGNVVGNIDVDAGVVVAYVNVQQCEHTLFALRPDQIFVDPIGTTVGPLMDITSLSYTYVNGEMHSETILINQYRGFDFTNLANPDNQTYTLYRMDSVGNRKASALYTVYDSTPTLLDSADYGELWFNKTQPTVYAINGSIGLNSTMKWSRLPASFLGQNGQDAASYDVVIDVRGDQVVLKARDFDTNTQTLLATYTTISTQQLSVYDLYTFNNGNKLYSEKVRSNDAFVLYEYIYKKSPLSIFHSPAYDQEPYSLVYTAIGSSIPFIQSKTGVWFNALGTSAPDPQPLFVQTSELTQDNSTSYVVITPPYSIFRQASHNAAITLPYDLNNIAEFDTNEIIVRYRPINSYVNNVYPFSTVPNTNDVGFLRNITKLHFEYIFAPDATTYTFNVQSSYTTITEHLGLNAIVPVVGGQGNYSGLITDLGANPNYTVTYNPVTLQRSVAFEQNSANNIINQRNVVFSIHAPILPPGQYPLNLYTGDGITVSLYSAVPFVNTANDNKYAIELNRFDCPNFDYSNHQYLSSMRFQPVARYTSVVTLPDNGNVLTATPYNLATDRSSLTTGNMTLTGGVINWTSAALPANFYVALTALTHQDGDTNIGGTDLVRSVLGTIQAVPVKYNYITTPDIFEVRSGDGSTTMKITPNGIIKSMITQSAMVNIPVQYAVESDSSSSEYVEYNAF